MKSSSISGGQQRKHGLKREREQLCEAPQGENPKKPLEQYLWAQNQSSSFDLRKSSMPKLSNVSSAKSSGNLAGERFS